MDSLISYQLHLQLTSPTKINTKKFGEIILKKGRYIYTGSAKKNIDSRINRHLKKDKKVHWHIDYLTTNENCQIVKVEKSSLGECILNQKIKGEIVIKDFGSSDCKSGCGSHLKFIP